MPHHPPGHPWITKRSNMLGKRPLGPLSFWNTPSNVLLKPIKSNNYSRKGSPSRHPKLLFHIWENIWNFSKVSRLEKAFHIKTTPKLSFEDLNPCRCYRLMPPEAPPQSCWCMSSINFHYTHIANHSISCNASLDLPSSRNSGQDISSPVPWTYYQHNLQIRRWTHYPANTTK